MLREISVSSSPGVTENTVQIQYHTGTELLSPNCMDHILVPRSPAPLTGTALYNSFGNLPTYFFGRQPTADELDSDVNIHVPCIITLPSGQMYMYSAEDETGYDGVLYLASKETPDFATALDNFDLTTCPFGTQNFANLDDTLSGTEIVTFFTNFITNSFGGYFINYSLSDNTYSISVSGLDGTSTAWGLNNGFLLTFTPTGSTGSVNTFYGSFELKPRQTAVTDKVGNGAVE